MKIRPSVSRSLAGARVSRWLAGSLVALAGWSPLGHAQEAAPARPQVSGIYPHLTMFNNEGECGTGAVVPWADRLWVITYGPHLPFGSSDKLYEISLPDLTQTIRPESVGGTPANRMLHAESKQLVIGPYFIDADRNVRVIPPKKMPGRLTGNARHLTDPAGKVYFATMEEGLYEVDVKTLAVVGLIRDGNPVKAGFSAETHPAKLDSQLPGYHGKGLYSGHGRVVYANNGDRNPKVVTDPTTPSGALGEWNGGGDWSLVRRNQFTEVTGPGGLAGNANPATDPIWSIGWDAKSLILMLLDEGRWTAYRLPKSSHSYDGAHGWNTEWPRIRDIGETDLLMTMHGTFWRFPRDFRRADSAGIAPRSNYLKVIGDFCRLDDRVVFGCDDTAKSEFLNKRKAKGEIAGPARSQSNLWFVPPAALDSFGPALGRGAVWLDEPVAAGKPSEPFLFAGYPLRGVHLAHTAAEPVEFAFEVDVAGNGTWKKLSATIVPAGGNAWVEFPAEATGTWIRLTTDKACPTATAVFHYRAPDLRTPTADPIFAGLAGPDSQAVSSGLLHAGGKDGKRIRVAGQASDGSRAYYELDPELKLRKVGDAAAADKLDAELAVPADAITLDAASVLFVDGKGKRWRLPKGSVAFDKPNPAGAERICREVCTERDLFNAGGTFFELPAENAGGISKIRPVATHNRRVRDYVSWHGLVALSGLTDDAPAGPHVVRSDDGKISLWLGAVDDLWRLGKPRGEGGPWKDSAVSAGVPSDPYLLTGYDHRRVRLSHRGTVPVNILLQVDVTGSGNWVDWFSVEVKPQSGVEHIFPRAFGGYWTRVVADRDVTATAWFVYE